MEPLACECSAVTARHNCMKTMARICPSSLLLMSKEKKATHMTRLTPDRASLHTVNQGTSMLAMLLSRLELA